MLASLMIHFLLARVAYGDVSEKLRLGLVPSSSNYPGLEEPLEGAAASTVLKSTPSDGSDNEDNLERLCNDPFHSFLCKPITRQRTRFNGKLRAGAIIPTGILSEASNLRESSIPSTSRSDVLKQAKSYKLPLQTMLSQNIKESEYQSYKLSNTELQSKSFSDSDLTHPSKNYNLSNFSENIKQLAKTSKPTTAFIPPDKRKPKQQLANTSQTLQQIQFNKLSGKSLQIDESNVSPDSTNLSPSIENISLTGSAAENGQNKEVDHSLERLCNDPFHSFLCKPSKRRKRIDGRIRAGAKIPSNVLIGSSSIVREARVLAPKSGSSQQSTSSGGVPYNYLPPNTDKPIKASSGQQPSSGYQYVSPGNSFTLPPQLTETLPPTNTQQTEADGGQNGYFYAKPSATSSTNYSTTQGPAPTDIQYLTPSKTGNTYIQPSGTSVKPSAPPTTDFNDYQSSSNLQPNIIQGGYNYPIPSKPFILPSTTIRPEYTSQTTALTTKKDELISNPAYQQSQTSTNQLPSNPTNAQQTVVSASGYNYEKPSIQLTLPTTMPEKLTTYTSSSPTTPPPISITTLSPTTFGYEYPKPSNIQENVVPALEQGYTYSKPQIEFTYPTTQTQTAQTSITTTPITVTNTIKPTTPTSLTSSPISITTNQQSTSGYQYPNPTNIQEQVVPSIQSGYTYSRPAIPLTYPTTQRPQTTQTAAQTSATGTTSVKPPIDSKPTNIQQNGAATDEKGYVYQKPSNSFTLPTQNPSTYPTSQTQITTNAAQTTAGYQYPKPTNINQNVVSSNEGGYVYPLPTTQTSPTTSSPTIATLLTNQTTLPTSQLSNDGYNYPKPTNIQQVEVPLDQSGYIYNKPQNSFTLPTSKRPVTSTIPTIQTTISPTTIYITTQSTIPSSQTVTTTNELQPTSQETTAGYQYTKPSNGTSLVPEGSQQNGYSYQKPSISFTYPKPTSGTTTYTRPLNSFENPKPGFQQNVGSPNQNGYVYLYPPPPQPTATAPQLPQSPELGYHYQRPANPFTLPPRSRSGRHFQRITNY